MNGKLPVKYYLFIEIKSIDRQTMERLTSSRHIDLRAVLNCSKLYSYDLNSKSTLGLPDLY